MKETYQLFVGTYSRPIRFGTGEILEGRGKGIHRYTFDAKTGTLYESTAPAPAENPSYLALSFDKQYLYAVNELKEYKNKAGGAVSLSDRVGRWIAFSEPEAHRWCRPMLCWA